MYFHYFVIISAWKMRSPSPKNALCQDWLKLAPWFSEIRFFLISYIFPCLLFTSLGKWRGLSFRQNWIPFMQGCFRPSLAEIGKVVLEENIFRFPQGIFAIPLLSSLGKGREPSLNKIEFPPYTVFTTGGTVALRSVKKISSRELKFCS